MTQYAFSGGNWKLNETITQVLKQKIPSIMNLQQTQYHNFAKLIAKTSKDCTLPHENPNRI